MTEAYVPAGEYTLVSMKLQDVFGETRDIEVNKKDNGIDRLNGVDLKMICYKFIINESLGYNAIFGSAYILDSTSLFYQFPIRGEEVLIIEIKDWYGNVRKEKFMVTGVTGFRPTKDTDDSVVEYQLELLSWGGWIAMTHAIRRSYNDVVSKMVEEVYKDYFLLGPRKPDGSQIEGTTKDLFVENTEGDQTLVVPYYNGLETMNFFARHSFGNQTSSYMFFERIDGFHFKTLDTLMTDAAGEEVPSFTFQNSSAESPSDGPAIQMEGLIDISFPNPYNTLGHLTGGTYYKRFYEVDGANRRVESTDYKYYDHAEEYFKPLNVEGVKKIQPSNTKEFVETFFKQGKRMLSWKDYPSDGEPNAPMVRPQPFRNQSVVHSWAITEHNNANAITVKIYGRTSIMPGGIVEINMPELILATGTTYPDEPRSGRYIIETVINTFEGDQFLQTLTLVRGGTRR